MLCENIDPRRHYCYLRSKEILSCDDQERIDGGQTRKDRASRLIDMLLTKGPTAFDELCASIKEERTQIFLLENLHKALEKELGTYARTSLWIFRLKHILLLFGLFSSWATCSEIIMLCVRACVYRHHKLTRSALA
jgi:Caspase recruitment domain